MKKGFVTTENYRRMVEAQKAVERRGASEAGMVIVKGPYGIGKTATVERFAVDKNAVFIRAMETTSKRGLLNEWAAKMGVNSQGSSQEVQARIISRSMVDMRMVVIDEADHLIRSTPALLEVVRDVTDMAGIALFMVGMEHFANNLSRYGHIASRVARLVEFRPLSRADVQVVCDSMCEVKLQAPVVDAVLQQSAGKMRLVLNALALLEQWAEANGWAEVGLEHIKGRPLVVDFRATGRGAL